MTLGDGSEIRDAVRGLGRRHAGAPSSPAAAGLPQGRGGRIDVQPDLTVAGLPGVYVVGDVANIPGPTGSALPQLGSVALQAGRWAGENILADIAGKQPRAVPLPGQGHHGDDRPRRGDRRGRPSTPRAARRRSPSRRGSACTPR